MTFQERCAAGTGCNTLNTTIYRYIYIYICYAMQCRNIFGRTFTPENPDFVLDHTSCLTCVSYHPLVPSLVAAGSFIGRQQLIML